jgi:hypothetical protein
MAPLFTGIAKNLGGYGFGRLAGSAPIGPPEFLYTGAQQTTVVVPSSASNIKFAGVAMGAPGGAASPPGPSGVGGGGGGANILGFTISPAVPYRGTTLYVGVGGPASPRNTYVRTTSHSGPLLFELNQGSGSTGGAANPTYSSTAGGNGGSPDAARFNPGTPGSNATNAAAGGGGGGGYGDSSPLTFGSPGGNGGNVTMSASPALLQPNGSSPWTWGTSTTGGAGGTQPGPAPGKTDGSPAPNSGAEGGKSALFPYYGTGGGGGAGIVINSISYGGGGGGAAYDFPTHGTQGAGAPGFLIVQFNN